VCTKLNMKLGQRAFHGLFYEDFVFFHWRIVVSKIHPTAIVDPQALIGNDVEIGAYAVVSGKVTIGDRCVIMNHAAIYGNLNMGCGNNVHPGAVIGGPPQDISYRGEPTWVEIGDNNTFRECVTINKATSKASGKTVIGNGNLLMAYTHIAHDCIIGNHNILPNGSMLGGHVIIGSHVHAGGLSGVHQFVTMGDYSFAGFSSRIVKDIPPYLIVEGSPAEPRTINQIGLERADFSPDDINLLKKAFKILYLSDKLWSEKISDLDALPFSGNKHVQYLKDFVVASSRGKNGRAQEKDKR